MKITPPDFQYVQTLARNMAGLIFEEDKQYLVESRLEPLATKLGYANIGELVEKARMGNVELHKRIVEALTIHETYFFRDNRPFEAMRKFVFPEWQKNLNGEKKIMIWSAACSSGQEPYSLAMMIKENFNTNEWKIRIIATDISEAILDKAKQGIYSQLEVGRGLSALNQGKFFTRCEGGWKVNDDIKQMIEFQKFNLSKDWPPMPQFDMILVRNVMIYFDNETKKQIFEKVRRLMKPNAYFFLGATESPIFLDSAFQVKDMEQAVCYTVNKEGPKS